MTGTGAPPAQPTSVVLGIVFTLTGIWLSYLLNVPSGATIILVSTLAYAGSLGIERLRQGD